MSKPDVSGPIETLPAGGDHDNGPVLMGVCLALTAVSALCVSLRCYARLCMRHNFGWDDTLIVLAMVSLIIGTALVVLAVQVGGMGRHLYYLPDPGLQLSAALKWSTFYQIDIIVGALLTKLSIGLFILRIKNDKKTRYIIGFTMVLMTSASLAGVVVVSVACVPLKKIWIPSIAGKCLPPDLVPGYFQPLVALVTDIVLTVSPIAILWNVQISRERKVAICVIMSLGLSATIANIMKIVESPALEARDYTCTSIPQQYIPKC
ncbi:hypothetical protein MMC30_008993 [Trapelia coarctata]|nr:hypothetical protein [Trapelia coarctata]